MSFSADRLTSPVSPPTISTLAPFRPGRGASSESSAFNPSRTGVRLTLRASARRMFAFRFNLRGRRPARDALVRRWRRTSGGLERQPGASMLGPRPMPAPRRRSSSRRCSPPLTPPDCLPVRVSLRVLVPARRGVAAANASRALDARAERAARAARSSSPAGTAGTAPSARGASSACAHWALPRPCPSCWSRCPSAPVRVGGLPSCSPMLPHPHPYPSCAPAASTACICMAYIAPAGSPPYSPYACSGSSSPGPAVPATVIGDRGSPGGAVGAPPRARGSPIHRDAAARGAREVAAHGSRNPRDTP